MAAIKHLFSSANAALGLACITSIIAPRVACADSRSRVECRVSRYEADPLIGQHECRPYAYHAAPDGLAKGFSFHSSVGLWHSRVPLRGAVQELIHYDNVEKFAGTTPAPEFDGPAAFTGVEVRVWFHLIQYVYAGFEMALAVGKSPNAAHASTAPESYRATQFTPGFGLAGKGMLFAGTRLPLGRLSLRFEAAVGGRAIDIDYKVKGAINNAWGASDSFWLSPFSPRVGADVWLTPWFSLQTLASFTPFGKGRGEVSMSLGVTWHSRAFEGWHSVW